MKARSRKYDEVYEVSLGDTTIDVWPDYGWVSYTPAAFFGLFEVLQPVSDTTKQAIQEIIEKVYYLGVASGRGAGLWPEQERYLDEAEYMEAVVSVLEGKE